MREWLGTVYIEPVSPRENGYLESLNGKLRDELLAREVFDTLLEAKVLIARWRRYYNAVRPHSSLGYRTRPHATNHTSRNSSPQAERSHSRSYRSWEHPIATVQTALS